MTQLKSKPKSKKGKGGALDLSALAATGLLFLGREAMASKPKVLRKFRGGADETVNPDTKAPATGDSTPAYLAVPPGSQAAPTDSPQAAPTVSPQAGGKKKRVTKKKHGGFLEQLFGQSQEDQQMEGGKKKRTFKKKHGGEDEQQMEFEQQMEGGKKKRTYKKKHGGEDEQQAEMEGGKKKKRVSKKKHGGADNFHLLGEGNVTGNLVGTLSPAPASQEAVTKQEGGKKKRTYKKKHGGEDEQQMEFEQQMEGGKKKKRVSKKKHGGALELYSSQLQDLTQKLSQLL